MAQQKEFKAESRRLLEMMIHSVYSEKEIFLREIISNASDAIDKRYYLTQTEGLSGPSREEYEIRIVIDKEKRTLTVSDNGIGMNAEDLENNLGVIAASDSAKFREELESDEKAKEASAADLIGRFGVGFYSAFMVADHITVISKKHGDAHTYKWESDGIDGFTIDESSRVGVGTDIIMHIRPDGEDKDEYSQYLREYPIYKLVKKYSDYVRFPIKMLMPQPEIKPGSDPEKPEFIEVFEYETLNSMEPIWTKRRSEVKKEDYEEFFKNNYHQKDAPRSIITASVEGNVTYKALLFIPAEAPAAYDTDNYRQGLTLYSSNVKILDYCDTLVPECFNFVRGVVDSPDVNLNLSREMLQKDRKLSLISANLDKKIKAELERMLRDERENYESFFKVFGRQLKVCAMDDFGALKEKLQDLLMFYSSKQGKLITLNEYVENMNEGQKKIYYASGKTVEAIEKMPQTEALREAGMDILLFMDQADSLVATMFHDYKGKEFCSAINGDVELNTKDQKETEAFKESFDFIKNVLGDKIDSVRASEKLKSHPVCLSSGNGVTFEMEKYFKATQPNMAVKAKKILEINTDHAAFAAFERTRAVNPDKAAKYAQILYTQALLIAGFPPEDASDYTDMLVSLW